VLEQIYSRLPIDGQNNQLRFDVITGLYNALTWLSNTYESQGDWQKAIERQDRLASLMSEVYGESNQSTIDARFRLGDLKILERLLTRMSSGFE